MRYQVGYKSSNIFSQTIFLAQNGIGFYLLIYLFIFFWGEGRGGRNKFRNFSVNEYIFSQYELHRLPHTAVCKMLTDLMFISHLCVNQTPKNGKLEGLSQ